MQWPKHLIRIISYTINIEIGRRNNSKLGLHKVNISPQYCSPVDVFGLRIASAVLDNTMRFTYLLCTHTHTLELLANSGEYQNMLMQSWCDETIYNNQ